MVSRGSKMPERNPRHAVPGLAEEREAEQGRGPRAQASEREILPEPLLTAPVSLDPPQKRVHAASDLQGPLGPRVAAHRCPASGGPHTRPLSEGVLGGEPDARLAAAQGGHGRIGVGFVHGSGRGRSPGEYLRVDAVKQDGARAQAPVAPALLRGRVERARAGGRDAAQLSAQAHARAQVAAVAQPAAGRRPGLPAPGALGVEAVQRERKAPSQGEGVGEGRTQHVGLKIPGSHLHQGIGSWIIHLEAGQLHAQAVGGAAHAHTLESGQPDLRQIGGAGPQRDHLEAVDVEPHAPASAPEGGHDVGGSEVASPQRDGPRNLIQKLRQREGLVAEQRLAVPFPHPGGPSAAGGIGELREGLDDEGILERESAGRSESAAGERVRGQGVGYRRERVGRGGVGRRRRHRVRRLLGRGSPRNQAEQDGEADGAAAGAAREAPGHRTGNARRRYCRFRGRRHAARVLTHSMSSRVGDP